jgi:PAS domain S-box-containing protein
VTPRPPSDFLETAPLVPIELEASTHRVLYVGPQCSALVGAPAESWLEPDFLRKRILPDDQGIVAQARSSAAAGGSGWVEYRMEHADGRVIWVSECTVAADGADGGPRLRGFVWDVTDRKRQELALWKREAKLRALLRSAPDAMVLTDLDGRIRDMNEQAAALFGYSPSDVIGSSFDHLVPSRLQPRLPELRSAFERDPQRKSLVDGQSFAIERRDGSEVPVELSMSLVHREDESPQLLCSVRDLTARRRMEGHLRTSERHLREMAQVMPAMVCFLDTEHRYRFVNEAYARWHGLERHQMEGRRLREVVGPKAHAALRASVDAALAGSGTHFRGAMEDGRGRSVPVDVSTVPLVDEEEQVSGYFLLIFDITDEMAAQEADRRHRAEIAHVSRVATLGELTASIAHELNQPLSAILANAIAARRMLDGVVPDLEEVGEALDDIASSGRRAGAVISGMRELLRKGEGGEAHDEVIDLTPLARDVIHLLRSEAIGRGVTLVAPEPPGASAEIRGDPVQIKQVLLNLLMNAIEAASRAPAGARTVVTGVASGTGVVEVTVQDSGPGLPTDDVEELLQPFVTRRPGGLGMGLAICRSIVEAHAGRIHGYTDPRGGAVFTVRLPSA